MTLLPSHGLGFSMVFWTSTVFCWASIGIFCSGSVSGDLIDWEGGRIRGEGGGAVVGLKVLGGVSAAGLTVLGGGIYGLRKRAVAVLLVVAAALLAVGEV